MILVSQALVIGHSAWLPLLLCSILRALALLKVKGTWLVRRRFGHGKSGPTEAPSKTLPSTASLKMYFWHAEDPHRHPCQFSVWRSQSCVFMGSLTLEHYFGFNLWCKVICTMLLWMRICWGCILNINRNTILIAALAETFLCGELFFLSDYYLDLLVSVCKGVSKCL